MVRRPWLVVGLAAALAIAGGALALRLEASAASDTLVDRDSRAFEATERYHQRFGEDAVLVLVSGPLERLVLTSDIVRLVGFEGCVSGNSPRGAELPGGPRGPCAALARSRPVQVVYGPGTFLNESVGRLGAEATRLAREVERRAERAARAAVAAARRAGKSSAEQRRVEQGVRELVEAEGAARLLRLALRYQIQPPFQLDNQALVASIVFDPARGARTPKSRFAFLFPNSGSALVHVRLEAGLSEEARRRAIGLVRAATRMPQWRLSEATYTVTGAPVVAEDLAESIADALTVLLIASLLVMAATLALVFRGRPRLLPLALGLGAATLTFGALSALGGSLTMASIAALPILIGLAVDYSIQFQARFEEERRARPGSPGEAAARAAARGGPTILTAGLATAAGMLALTLSPVPMVRSFGLLLVAGVALALAWALIVGLAALSLTGHGRDRSGIPPALRAALGGARQIVSDGARSLGAVRARTALHGFGARALGLSTRRPWAVLLAACVLALVGFAFEGRAKVVADVRELVPADLRGLRDLNTLQRATGAGGELVITVRARDLTEPAVVRWMRDTQAELLERNGYSAKAGCGRADLCPALSLPDLFRSNAALVDRRAVRALLRAVPRYFSQAVITPDHRVGALAFGIRLMPLDRQQALIDDVRERLDPPAGVSAELAGLPVLAAASNAELSSSLRRLLTLGASLAAIALVLLAVYRRPRFALPPLVPVALASGWSSLVLFITGVPLNPMTATLSALVVAIATQFGVLISARYREERAAGHPSQRALERTYASTGAAVLASGATAIAGFGVLAFSDIRMLSDFGIVTVVDLGVALAGVLIVLPAVLVLSERGRPLR